VNVLEQIVADKRVEMAARREELPLMTLESQLAAVAARPCFAEALRSAPMGLIAEVKRRSPSAGLIREPFDPAMIARDYEVSGAQAISCLMDHTYFGGGAADFALVRQAVSLPMLYKEFVVDPWQIVHAKVTGASAVLLIVGVLTDRELVEMREQIQGLGMDALVEVHDEEEMRRAIDSGAELIGINNRNLKTFETRLETTFELKELAPEGCLLVSESGIRTAADVLALKEAGAEAILVGERLLREASPGRAVEELMRFVW
jgi:indole-3-glycerol phosphate synthase